MDFSQFINQFLGREIFTLFFKVFSVVFSLLYLIYSLVIYKQTQVMTRTLESQETTLIQLISLIQIIIGLALLFVSLLIV
ncbi:hypothetical protein A2767_04480 [Candidatus Roizmanbacteria bacterium RIFCSPHIGHO2_01_FULL_35_10]|uniref:Uncharacterized protein n=1 Tax=Candidatus Roizmanbacteria bacterium RIFCSPLOWO2_01_FULL_35_13 TaxID=1802055 RepID=A0A1F7IH24_9BACT|nr:MAG: hypothetical protein A2767_04480 [Candidatus Roizmanbacteria bacterium RIFCSPHIGHO2_01_FULL_35_10]OGK42650.1 MAG: hypothetical protein A3A74_06470 [Candidatus Roizmanbacteria bacterium RIFCSPLOWO2_01_FULL_35_13]